MAHRWVAADGDLGGDERVRGRPEHNQLQLVLVEVQGAAAERRDEDENQILDSFDVDVESRAARHGFGSPDMVQFKCLSVRTQLSTAEAAGLSAPGVADLQQRFSNA